MHILTKVFVVLVSLLAVALVPLAAVQSSNQGALKQQISDKEAAVRVARGELDAERALRAKSENDTALQIKDLDSERIRLQSEIAQSATRIKTLDAEVAQFKARLSGLEQTLSVMTETDRAKTDLTKTLSEELDTQRTLALDCEKTRIDVEQRMGKSESDLRVAQEALGDLKEQVSALSSAQTKSDQIVRDYTAKFGVEAAGPAGGEAATAVADRSIVARVIDVKRTGDSTYAEIDAGSRDGVRVGWTLTIGDGSRFIGRLRITSVDMNKSVGLVELEDPAGRGSVSAGQRVSSRKGR
ncbi:MAG: hypothetical protein EXS03_00820 [Phycisphaerales bacterium]|nr:hypothetical protein [Phycisphaerales bacterium]